MQVRILPPQRLNNKLKIMEAKKELQKTDYNVMIKVERDEESTWYVAFCEELGISACHGIGGTPDEALSDFLQAKEELLEIMAKRGDVIPVAKQWIEAQLNKKEPMEDAVELPLDVLDEIIEYIKETEEIIDEDLRPIRDLKTLVRNLKMPRLYDRLIEIRDGREDLLITK